MRRGDRLPTLTRAVLLKTMPFGLTEDLADGVDRARDVGGARLVTLFSVIWLGSIWLNVTDSLPATSKVFQLMTALDVVWLMTVFVGRPATLPGLSCQMKALPCVTVPLVGAARACGGALSPAAATAASTARAPETPDFPRRRAHSLATVQHALLAFHITV